MTLAPGSPPGPPPSPPPGPAVGFGKAPDPTQTPAGGASIAIVPVIVLPYSATVTPTQLLRGLYLNVEIENVGCASAWVGPRSVLIGSGVRIRAGETKHIPSTSQDGLWAIPEFGGAVLELAVIA